MHITKLVYVEMPTDEVYSQLNALGCITITDYGTIEITKENIEYAKETIVENAIVGDEEITLTELDELLVEGLGSDVLEALMNDTIDLVMLIC